ncbi:hypothetical protein SNEBB_003661 [Seison nebaliae]|nr:hypothetical protein SNEBB_003661 [Seison nebaliae]
MSSPKETSKSKVRTTKIVEYYNGYVLRDGYFRYDKLIVKNGKIMDPRELFFSEKKLATERVDLKGGLIAPGFIDVQINGAFGVDFSSPTLTLDDIKKCAKNMLQYGVTSFCPTIITSSTSTYKTLIKLFASYKNSEKSAQILGMHLEGPFISPEKKGAHPIDLILDFKRDTDGESGSEKLNKVYGTDYKTLSQHVSIITIAPELSGAIDVIKDVTTNTEKRTVVSIGHSTGSLTDGCSAVMNGARFITHLFNAMMPFHHRDPHLIGLLAMSVKRDEANHTPFFYGIISDGIHTHKTALNLVYRVNPDGFILITDAIAALGLGEGEHNLGEKVVKVTKKKDSSYKADIAPCASSFQFVQKKLGHFVPLQPLYDEPERKSISSNDILVAVLKDNKDTLAGSVASMINCIHVLYSQSEVPLGKVIEFATLHPAQLLNRSHQIGTLNHGSDANFVILDPKKLTVQQTFVNGRLAYSA